MKCAETMKTEPRYYIFQATFLAFEASPWKSCAPVSHLPDAIGFFAVLRGKRHSTTADVAFSSWARVAAGRDGRTARNSRWKSPRAEGAAPQPGAGAPAGKGLPRRHGTRRGVRPGNPALRGHQPRCKPVGCSGMQISCASAETTGLLCLTSCRWKTAGNVSRSGFESWPVATINKKLKSFTVCTYSF